MPSTLGVLPTAVTSPIPLASSSCIRKPTKELVDSSIPKDPIVVSTNHVPVMSATSVESSARVVVEVDVVMVGPGSVGNSGLLWVAAISSASATHSSNVVSSAKHSSSH